jgi:hypothetical protein
MAVRALPEMGHRGGACEASSSELVSSHTSVDKLRWARNPWIAALIGIVINAMALAQLYDSSPICALRVVMSLG